MLIQLHSEAPPAEVRRQLQALGLWTRDLKDAEGRVGSMSIQAGSAPVSIEVLRALPGVADVHAPASPHPLVDHARGRPVTLGTTSLNDGPPILIAGPCSIESEAMIHDLASVAATAGATFVRGGAYKPRTSPHQFSGHGEVALTWIREAADAVGLQVVTEVLSENTVEAVARCADMLQIGSRNMQNFALLHAVGRTGIPVLLKRANGASIEEWLLAGEHLLHAGTGTVVFCERGIRGFDPHTRNLLDMGAIAVLRHEFGLPVIADPSHGSGRRDLVVPLALSAVAAGAHGVMVEISRDPSTALSDGPQAILPETLQALSEGLQITEQTP